MTIQQILDHVYPLTPEIRKCSYKRQRWNQNRSRLQAMIEAHKRGDVVNWQAMRISVDMNDLLSSNTN